MKHTILWSKALQRWYYTNPLTEETITLEGWKELYAKEDELIEAHGKENVITYIPMFIENEE